MGKVWKPNKTDRMPRKVGVDRADVLEKQTPLNNFGHLKLGTPGIVTRVHEAWDGHEDLSVRWDDGGTDPLAPAKDFTLNSRQA